MQYLKHSNKDLLQRNENSTSHPLCRKTYGLYRDSEIKLL